MNSATATRTSAGHVKMTGAHKWGPIDDLVKPVRMEIMSSKIVTEHDLAKALKVVAGSMEVTPEDLRTQSILDLEAGTCGTVDQFKVALQDIQAAKISELRAALGRQLEPAQNYTLAELNAVKTPAMTRARTGV